MDSKIFETSDVSIHFKGKRVAGGRQAMVFRPLRLVSEEDEGGAELLALQMEKGVLLPTKERQHQLETKKLDPAPYVDNGVIESSSTGSSTSIKRDRNSTAAVKDVDAVSESPPLKRVKTEVAGKGRSNQFPFVVNLTEDD
ncbi:hypothetical protein M427DRAFT_47383 [Gonapodya prolifera JEL478]|uniref:Uncharacterized protein n=1 Tax=Gonapodya prolifera (strain JEL478) TaxID=1344416 RepID=A0A139A350_GONPJ|nr:hypothetical protein M427DRAFT_47383 [Gonapodya prolifera JEL478]|eukprot:KXS11191.1 hypothetical protein M427DRAFT_47383 [Gonapodya prolifera JEL478]